MYTLHLRKERFSFKVAHFAIFGPYEAERLHGHNYYVSLDMESAAVDADLGLVVEFNAIKPHIEQIIRSLDEFILIPDKTNYLQVRREGGQVLVQFNDKHYSFPAVDVMFVPIVNTSVEELARYLWERIAPALRATRVETLQVTIEETRGQSASFRRSLKVD
jgi:6-pyruvoyltetrahydropterin/6-carboxytetrahydropterin synthase